jgi:uncharacterized membrane protein YfcA
MATIDAFHMVSAFLAAFVAGAINSVAGGGTMITFPVLIALGLPPIIANATNTVGIWPGSAGSIWGFRREFARIPTVMRWLLIPACVGGAVGAMLLRLTPPVVFDRLVPWLILFATVLFILQTPIQRKLKSAEAAQKAGSRWMALAICAQVAVAVYGGYFGAGMGILLLAVMALSLPFEIQELQGLRSVLSLIINALAALIFVLRGHLIVDAVYMFLIGTLVGGWLGAMLILRLSPNLVRIVIIVVGVITTIRLAVTA